MKLQSATIKNFKRFTHLTIQNIPSSARLIMLAGPNGCGKSSLFDAFNIWHRKVKRPRYDPNWQTDYHSKVTSPTERFNDQVDVVSTKNRQQTTTRKRNSFTYAPRTETTLSSRSNNSVGSAHH